MFSVVHNAGMLAVVYTSDACTFSVMYNAGIFLVVTIVVHNAGTFSVVYNAGMFSSQNIPFRKQFYTCVCIYIYII